jgi:glutamate N-acetyltransferase/amino-acid N-acetyltransferase
VPFDANVLRDMFRQPQIDIEVRLGLGDGSATAWGTDLSAEYVRLNAEYTT